MARPPRLHFPGAFYHVTLRGNHRRDIFFSAAHRRLLDDLTAEILERFTARLHAYCWMTNHVHMLMQVGDAPLGRLIMRIAGRYARMVQKRLLTTGHLFENRYHAVLVDADEYLLELLRYIHLNPVRAHMVKHPAEYPWCSHHDYVSAAARSWVTTDFALRMFHAERDRAVAAYCRFIDEGVGHPTPSPLKDCNSGDTRILGSDAFAEKLLGSDWQPRTRKALADLIAEACARFCVSEAALLSASAQRDLTKARAWVAHQAITLRISSLSAVARHFRRSEGALRHSVKRHFNGP